MSAQVVSILCKWSRLFASDVASGEVVSIYKKYSQNVCGKRHFNNFSVFQGCEKEWPTTDFSHSHP
jgi:hypothetical protein